MTVIVSAPARGWLGPARLLEEIIDGRIRVYLSFPDDVMHAVTLGSYCEEES